MKPSRINFLTLSDLEERISNLERIYGLTTAEFLANKEEVPEDDALVWEAYFVQSRQLVSLHQQLRSNYLRGVKPQADRGYHKIEPASLAA